MKILKEGFFLKFEEFFLIGMDIPQKVILYSRAWFLGVVFRFLFLVDPSARKKNLDRPTRTPKQVSWPH